MRLVQETLKGTNDLSISQNYRIANTGKRKREIDILIEANINGFVLRIAIECKRYSKPVPVKEVEAFNSKCQRLPGISKKVFISSSGYQADALLAARDFDIEALTAEALNADTVKAWVPIQNLNLVIDRHCENVQWHLDCFDSAKIKQYQDQSKLIAKIDKKHEIHLNELLSKALNSAKDVIWKLAILEAMKSKMSLEPFLIPLRIATGNCFIETESDGFVKILGVTFNVKVQFQATPAEIIDARDLTDTGGNWRARSLSVVNQDGLHTNIIDTGSEAPSLYISNNKGEFVKLKTLLRYDPTTGEFSGGEDAE